MILGESNANFRVFILHDAKEERNSIKANEYNEHSEPWRSAPITLTI